ncbi:bifunctional 2-polyprenyl-6-hydroxyphenol methylase/3-demethylubiquinol 3-O-methyltransferase UbiG [Nostoc sp. CHAB 5784]|uniref:bifunctional 2-polyprenyl-6-hydroxyphenol methylase/3-demethylubiquinol 3-O-methyltransferase UbiG n=1 Tax=Nostoc mirabile TaxID=2907820 RepID=UPI001E3A24EA|nr:bifunctional 2-polyprenyl-6-hydroxyphenol methylase/3-demethylubiquinol 3-O-methyltransferase UbiG [Nostoc mirabile]MCC5668401.1 bifunctional 2-polyprenyl-6-hydroxyphenol methylase/3-demethylubiquinol 3-O-methyltransferase UbiG [Nostoc mirabile CHAB5784]
MQVQNKQFDDYDYNSNADKWWNEGTNLHALFYFNKPRFEFFDRHVPNWQGLKALDVGCGGGFTCEFMAKRGVIVSGIDPVINSIQVAQEHASKSGLKIDYKHGFAENLPYDDNSFDIVTCVDVLEHVADLNKVLSEINRVLKPNGLFLFDTINRNFKSKIIMIWILENITKDIDRGVHNWQKFIKPKELLHLLKDNGFADTLIKGFHFKGRDKKTGEIRVILDEDTSVMYIGKAVKTSHY